MDPMRPKFSEAEAVRLARRVYGLTATARELPSERDQNFLLSSRKGKFVLKIAAAGERAEVLDLQNQALEWLAARAKSLPLPRVHGPMKRSEERRVGKECRL